MNIWYFHHYATPYEIPGLHRPFEFGSYFRQSGNRIAVFTSSYLHYSGEHMIKNRDKRRLEEYDGVETIFVRTCGYESKLNRVWNMIQFAHRLFSNARWFVKNRWKPDVIVASSPHPLTMLAGLKIAKKLGIPCVCEVRDFWPEVFFLGGVIKEQSLVGKALLRGERYIYQKADKLVFLKEGDHTYITDHKWDIESGGKIDMSKCEYVNNGVDLALFDKRLRENEFNAPDFDRGKFTVVYCGTIRPINNIDMLLDVAKLLDDNVQFLIFGTGNCVDAINARIKDENITNVFLKGYVDNRLIPNVLSQSSLNILNYSGSTYNWSRGNSSNKLFEYLASGKPVLSTVKMGYDIIERYHCGLSVEHCTAEEVARAIEQIRAMPAYEYEEMCRNARSAASNFDIPVLANQYLTILKNLMPNERGQKND